jgi:vacuolar protein sorting-associated protein 13A/C
LTSNLYVVALRLTPNQNLGSESLPHQQSARTSGSISNFLSDEQQLVNWSEIFFFKVDSPVWNITCFLIEFQFVNLFPVNY